MNQNASPTFLSLFSSARRVLLGAALSASVTLVATTAHAEAEPARMTIQVDQPGIKISPILYGLMTEEINYSFQGGLYGELIQNRDFKEDKGPSTNHWSLVTAAGAAGTMTLDPSEPVNSTALTSSLRLDITTAHGGQRVGVANDGYWGIPVTPDTAYRASFYARAGAGFTGPLTVSIESKDGATTYAQAQVGKIGEQWKLYTVPLTTGKAAATKDTRCVVSAAQPGAVWLTQVSLFPPTYHNRPNGSRIDLMQKLGAMKPAFLRLPGGNYLEGDTFAERFDWSKTIGNISERPGHRSPWNYHSTDGFGLLEMLCWCEDLHMQPVLAVFAGYALKNDHVVGDKLQPFIDDALEEVEYITGSVSTPWGARRAADGHPAPFPLEYVEIGNEDFFDHSGSYDQRFAQFYDAFKARYPKLKLIATAPIKTRTPDLYDDHFYNTWDKMVRDVHHYDATSRTGPKVFVGEWASQDVPSPWVNPEKKGPTPSMKSALGDAAWMIGLERNSDVVVMQCYAPLLVNVNPGGRQWAVNLIGYDALHSFVSPSYHAQAMFANNRGDVVLPVRFFAEVGLPVESAPHGKIGLGTWLTQAEFKDIQVTQGSQVLFQSDFSNGTDPWHLDTGKWANEGEVLSQSSNEINAHATVGDAQWADYTYSLKARKISGDEGFLIRFHVQDDANYLHWNIGGWGNHSHGLEKVRDGKKNDLGGRVTGAIETGRWYDIRVELRGTEIRCFLDGKLVLTGKDGTSAPEPMIATASRDLATGDVILKAVNTTAKPQQYLLDFQGVKDVLAQATGQVLTGEMGDINTLTDPEKVAPRTVSIDVAARSFPYEFPPRSVSVLRFKTVK